MFNTENSQTSQLDDDAVSQQRVFFLCIKFAEHFEVHLYLVSSTDRTVNAARMQTVNSHAFFYIVTFARFQQIIELVHITKVVVLLPDIKIQTVFPENNRERVEKPPDALHLWIVEFKPAILTFQILCL